ncbi:MAG: FMN-binding glutamate synthase family protein [Elusimicrobia bacterium]|nr:FMN-binding glutamate synthase family protein [Elusimicrobiota bacterium]
MIVALAALAAALLLLAARDRWLSDDNIIRNFPIIGHLRYLLIEIGPELRQYIVAANHEEFPFNRDDRDWIDRSAKGGNNYFGFGTDDNVLQIGYPIIKHSAFPHGEVSFTASVHDKALALPCAKVLGEVRGRKKAWRPASIVNISAMSFGSLSAPAVIAMNKGAKLAGCWHNTGEGGLAPHHRHGADVIYQIGTGYFGSRAEEGGFSMEKLLETVATCPTVRGIEVKLSQGAKPGKGGVLPGRKVTAEIAGIRGVKEGRDCVSPNGHAAFKDVRGLIDFVERIAEATGLPVGIKSAVGQEGFWKELAAAMVETGRGPDWITIDGGEGGTGAAPMTFADHVSLPFRVGFTRVYKIFVDAKAAERVVWIGSAKLGFPDRAVVAFSLGADLINVAREAMIAIGCIQAQRCHTDFCPTGVATHNAWLQRGLKPELAAARFMRYCQSFRNELLAVTHACGYEHPSQFTSDDIEVSAGPGLFKPLREVYGYTPQRSWAGIGGWPSSA